MFIAFGVWVVIVVGTIVIAIVVGLCALFTFSVLDRLFSRLVSWMPRLDDGGLTQVAGVGAVGAGKAAGTTPT